MNKKAKNKTAIITGASKGIGKACAIALLQDGWNTVFVARDLNGLNAAIKEAGDVEAQALAISCDVTQEDQVISLFDNAKKEFGSIDLLFNNAGITGPIGTIDTVSLEEWNQTVNINLTGAFLCAKTAFATMKEQQPQGGRIINNGSIAAYSPRPQTVPYTATKHAITGLTKCLSLDGREFDITCSQIDIGNVLTEMAIPMTQGVLQANGERKPEPVFDVKHVADAILYIANLPPEANVQFMNVMASKMPFIGRG